jgi:hypothetical protein
MVNFLLGMRYLFLKNCCDNPYPVALFADRKRI